MISAETDVYIRSANNKIAYIGEQANIEEAKQEIKELIESKKTLKKKIEISPDNFNYIKNSID